MGEWVGKGIGVTLSWLVEASSRVRGRVGAAQKLSEGKDRQTHRNRQTLSVHYIMMIRINGSNSRGEEEKKKKCEVVTENDVCR